jgi:hypothetical protein
MGFGLKNMLPQLRLQITPPVRPKVKDLGLMPKQGGDSRHVLPPRPSHLESEASLSPVAQLRTSEHTHPQRLFGRLVG